MALIKCPECGREISDKVKACPQCGYPFEDTKTQIDQINNNGVQTVLLNPQKDIRKILIAIITVLVIIIIAVVAYYFTSIIPQKEYSQAISMLETGDYEGGQAKLKKLGDYKDSAIILEQIKYESLAYACINDVKECLRNPDSYTPYDIKFYTAKGMEDDPKPSCIMYFGAQNGFGGNTTGYALLMYNEGDEAYEVKGIINTLDEEELKKKDKNYSYDIWTLKFITEIQWN